jgi:MFS family permease
MPADQNQKSIWAVFGALFLALWLAALDQTVVSTALPTMVAELGGLSYLSWVVTCSSRDRRCAASRRTCCS